jgi:hypothetical protein
MWAARIASIFRKREVRRSSASISCTLPQFGPAYNWMMRPTEIDLGWQIPPLLSAKRTGDDDRFKGEFGYSSGNITPALLAFDDEQLAFLDSECHGRTSIRDQT